jgi:hypothetical protein
MDASAPDIKDLRDQLDAAERDACELVANLNEERGRWRPATGSWSVAECLDHLAIANRVYLHSMREPAIRAREQGRIRLGPATPGFVGGVVREYVGTAGQGAIQDEGASEYRAARGAIARSVFRKLQDLTG